MREISKIILYFQLILSQLQMFLKVWMLAAIGFGYTLMLGGSAHHPVLTEGCMFS